uniref:Putative secreted protein n=1 Tax=Ixodes ricinus TaxID=34613 RepID=A0A6B0UEK2_IXORI
MQLHRLTCVGTSVLGSIWCARSSAMSRSQSGISRLTLSSSSTDTRPLQLAARLALSFSSSELGRLEPPERHARQKPFRRPRSSWLSCLCFSLE